jgi:prepilin peptidase CpaA
MNASHIASGIILALVLGASVYTDLRYGKILNKVVLPCVPLGLLIWGLGAGPAGLAFSLQGMAVASIALAVAATLAWMAPGDAKLILAIGALKGPAFVGSTMILGALIGGVIGVIILARRRLLGNVATSAAVALGSHLPLSTVWSARAGHMPYSLAIALGAVAAGLIPLW